MGDGEGLKADASGGPGLRRCRSAVVQISLCHGAGERPKIVEAVCQDVEHTAVVHAPVAVNNRMITPKDFIAASRSVSLTPAGRTALRSYEQRMDHPATHPLFGYRVNYRRILEIQTRLLARVVTGEVTRDPGFETR